MRLENNFKKANLNADDNLQFYPNKPKMNDCSIISLSICVESIGVDSENYLWSKINKDYKSDFPQLIDRSNFNKRRRRLHRFIHEVTRILSGELNKSEDIFIMDSIPVPICKIARESVANLEVIVLKPSPIKGIRQLVSSIIMAINCIW